MCPSEDIITTICSQLSPLITFLLSLNHFILLAMSKARLSNFIILGCKFDLLISIRNSTKESRSSILHGSSETKDRI